MWCNHTLDSQPGPSQEEYEELDKSLNEFEASIDESNIRYWRLLKKRKGRKIILKINKKR